MSPDSWIRSWLRKTPLRRVVHGWRELREMASWRLRGCPGPAPARYKAAVLVRYGRRYGLRTLIETGTWRGDTVARVADHFDRIHTIEIMPDFVVAARERFAGDARVRVHEGDSAEILPRILSKTAEPCLFWLDGHYSGPGTGRSDEDTPVRAELRAIVEHGASGHVVLIDDARCFGTDPTYPSIADVRRTMEESGGGWQVEVEKDIIRIVDAPTRSGPSTPHRDRSSEAG